MKKSLLLFVFVAGFLAVATAQDKAQMERERAEIQREISDLQSMYNKVKGEKSVSLSQANLIKRKITLQEKYLNNINRELRLINDDIYYSTLEINKLKRQVDTLKDQYARSVVYAYKNRSSYDYLNFIFSASSFNDALKRISYLKSYRSYREQQVNNILETQKLIEQRIKEQNNRKNQKNVVIKTQVKEIKVLEDQKKEKDAVVSKLKSQEKQLSKQISDKKKKDAQLKNAIAAIVRREIEEAKKEAARKAAAETKTNTATPGANTNTSTTETKTAAAKPKSYLDLNAADIKLNTSFATNKGKLPWPVDKGVISVNFGNYTLEGTKLKGYNPGLTISTSAGATVKSVFDGEVAAIFNIGDGMAVTIRHGKYFTTYSNLSSVSVSKGAAIRTGQAIGRAGSSEDGAGGQIDFILMIETRETNPEPWLR